MSLKHKQHQGHGQSSQISTTQPDSTKRTAGSDVPPNEDNTSEWPQQEGRQQAHQTTVVDNTPQGKGPQI